MIKTIGNKIKIRNLENGKIIWKYKPNEENEILGITGATLEEKYYEKYCKKIVGNDFDYLIMEDE